MSVTYAKGFLAAGVAAGLKQSGKRDVSVVQNLGPEFSVGAVFTSNRFCAAPVVWSREVVAGGNLRALVTNSGGANACTGAAGMADTKATAAAVGEWLELPVSEVAVCSTGLIGELLPMANVLAGVAQCVAELSETGGAAAAEAIMTTDSVAKVATFDGAGWRIGGMAKGAGMLAPGLATMLVTITTDVSMASADLQSAISRAAELTFNRIDSDGCMSTNDTVLLLASGASGVRPDFEDFLAGLVAVCQSLARQLIADAEGATKDIAIRVESAATEHEAVEVARAVSRSNLLKCAIHGEDPNWGRILSAVGTTSAQFEPGQVDVAMNGVWICRGGAAGDDRGKVDLSGREVQITISLNAGEAAATLWTNDLTAMYVHENSAYSS